MQDQTDKAAKPDHYASSNRRIAGFLIDALIAGTIAGISEAAVDYGSVIAWPAYWVLFALTLGRTPGKLVLGMYVVDRSGRRPPILSLLVREALIRIGAFVPWIWATVAVLSDPQLREDAQAGIGPFFGLLLSLGILGVVAMALAGHPERRGWHDRIAGTWVEHSVV